MARCPRCENRFPMPEDETVIAAVPVAVPAPKLVTRALPSATAPSVGARPKRSDWWLVLVVGVVAIATFGLLAIVVVVAALNKSHDQAVTPVIDGRDRTPAQPENATSDLSQQVRTIFETNCLRCHGQDDSAEADVRVLDRDRLVAKQKIVPGDPDNSRLYQRITSAKRPMPPEDEEPRPSAADIARVKEWIAAGAPPIAAAAAPTAQASTQLDTRYLLTAIRKYLVKVQDTDRKYQRFFTMTHVANNPAEAASLPIYRAGLVKLLNSLSWKKTIVQPRPVDSAQTIYALDLRELDWDTPDRWQDITRLYPYGLHYDGRVGAALRPLADAVERLAKHPLPYVRADWFIANASRPPLYNTLLSLPANARTLEQQLGVDLAADFLNGKLRRTGFLKSNVSSQNRLLERHDSRFGAYWRSYDFKTSQNRDSLIAFPLGPGPAFIPNHPAANLAFEQAGGELIFNLPNGLQGYMLVDGKDKRIDIAPIEVVRDREESSGTPQIVNGLSCMACHVNGMITGDNLKDVIRAGSAVEGPTKTLIDQLYASPEEMDQLLKRDADRFQRSMKRTLEPFNDHPVEEPISAVAKPFLRKTIDLKTAAYELGVSDPQTLQQAIETNRTLRQLGLEPLVQGNAIQRASWEQVQGDRSLFQQVANELGLGGPLR
jgi:serine/threonine-protein kinase